MLLLNVAISFLDINTFEAYIRREIPMHMKIKIHEQGRQWIAFDKHYTY